MTDDDHAAGSMRRAWTAMAAVGFTNLQMALTLSMAFVVFPDLERAFPDASSATLSWAVNLFTIVGASTLVLGAALARRWGDKRTLLLGTALFTASSVAAALAPGLAVLIACRVGQALASSLVIPAGASVIYREFPFAKRGVAVTTAAGIGALGATAGPSLGGLLIDIGSWRWSFWMNLPLGVVACAVVARLVSPAPTRERVPMPDPWSSVLLTGGIGLAVLALVQTPSWGWVDVRTIVTFAVGIVLLASVLQRSAHHPRPLLELGLLTDRRFGIGTLAVLVWSVSFFGLLFTNVLFLTGVWDTTIRRAGLLTTPVFALTALMTFTSNPLARRVGERTTLALGAALWGCGTATMALVLPATAATATWLVAIVVTGAGSGLLWGSMMAVSLSTLPAEAMASATGLSQTLQNIGSTVGVGIMVTVLGEAEVGDRGAFPAAWIASAVMTVAAVVLCTWVADGRRAGARRRAQPSVTAAVR